MRKQQLQEAPRGGTCSRTLLAVSAVVTALALYVVPVTVSADIELDERYMTPQQARMTHGEELYNELCAVCHGRTGKGDGPAVPALNQRPTDLTVLTVSNDNEFPRVALEESIYGKNRIRAHGTLDMPIWGRAFEFANPDWGRHRRQKFAKHRIHNIVEYIESLQVEESSGE